MRKIDKSVLRHLIEIDLMTQDEAASYFQCNRTSIQRMCRRLGLLTQRTGPRSGDQHPDWKGGRRKVGGYWYIYSPQHPNRTKQNTVAEHRLVMEEKLGRHLLRSEVVHHINGDPEDNRPENLHVFSTNAEHLQHELSGHIPHWTPEGLDKIAAGLQKRTSQILSGVGVPQRSQTTGRWIARHESTPEEAS